MSKLTGKVAVVTGASKGIGAAIAKALAAEGASVVVNYASSKAGADAVVAAITAAGGKAVAVPGDVSKAAEAQGIIEAAIKNYGRLDIPRKQRRRDRDLPFPRASTGRVETSVRCQSHGRVSLRTGSGTRNDSRQSRSDSKYRLCIRGRGCSKASRVLRDEGGCRHADKGPSNRVGVGRPARKRHCSWLCPNRSRIKVG